MQLFVNDLTVIDFSYLCPERGIVGESWIVDIVLDGSLNEQSMVLDFGRVKKQIKRIIDDAVDHKLAVPANHLYTAVTHDADDSCYWVDFMRPDNASIHLFCPADAFAFIDAERVTMATVNSYLRAVIKRQLPGNVEGLEVTLRAEQIDGAYYHYTHGLKKHDGNCQRIAHGHRSRIKVELDGERATDIELRWAERWRDIYLGSTEDVCTIDALQRSERAQACTDSTHVGYGYDADQGRFELLVPKAENYIIDNDSTVECIADYLAQAIRQELSEPQEVTVKAYEGVGKGAIGYA
ncbi:6-carboxytetrahydropterin synthase [Pseudidiomarina sp. 1ASP75-14]|uniref:6-carboxytetrahydropterin synthase n=1 Tax=Pseudidiomarina terrestris TaxID=2820060 RepID=UPI002654F66B|nr:6-carboxytetrahydropterin synthase [Pseudidiomarina sp. 1ASP75-14]MDN7137852.1 6-carboxytetrahydropterin synthase [Pseudidiomarina sp. 1ASP75-14]